MLHTKYLKYLPMAPKSKNTTQASHTLYSPKNPSIILFELYFKLNINT